MLAETSAAQVLTWLGLVAGAIAIAWLLVRHRGGGRMKAGLSGFEASFNPAPPGSKATSSASGLKGKGNLDMRASADGPAKAELKDADVAGDIRMIAEAGRSDDEQ